MGETAGDPGCEREDNRADDELRSNLQPVDTGLYYLQSRYYDPETCRFVNADRYASTGQGLIGINSFSYCNNNPVVCKDSEGTLAKTALVNDGGSASSVNADTDNNAGSKTLCSYLIDNNYIPDSNGPANVRVETAGIYSHKSSNLVSKVLAWCGLGTTMAAPVADYMQVPLTPETQNAIMLAGVVVAVCGVIDLFVHHDDSLAEKDYYMYKVTTTWNTMAPINPESTIYIRTLYKSVDYYVWNDTRIGNEGWYSIDYSCSFYTETIEIPMR